MTNKQQYWQLIKSYSSARLKDIYIFDMNDDYWKKWVEYVNASYKIRFIDRDTESETRNISFEQLKQAWIDGNSTSLVGIISLGNVILQSYFNSKILLENDIDLNTTESEEDFYVLEKYLKDLSELLQKRVILTEEMNEDEVLLEVFQGEVKCYL